MRRIKSDVSTVIGNYFPRIVIRQFDVTSDLSNSSIGVFIKYQVSESSIEDEILINIEQ